jgi:hypothetical protein
MNLTKCTQRSLWSSLQEINYDDACRSALGGCFLGWSKNITTWLTNRPVGKRVIGILLFSIQGPIFPDKTLMPSVTFDKRRSAFISRNKRSSAA